MSFLCEEQLTPYESSPSRASRWYGCCIGMPIYGNTFLYSPNRIGGSRTSGGPKSFIFMQFLAKILPNNSFFPKKPRVGAPHSMKSWIRHWTGHILTLHMLGPLFVQQSHKHDSTKKRVETIWAIIWLIPFHGYYDVVAAQEIRNSCFQVYDARTMKAQNNHRYIQYHPQRKECSHLTEFSPSPKFGPILFCIRERNFSVNGSTTHST